MKISINIDISNEELKDLLGLHSKPVVREKDYISPYARFFDEDSAAWTKNPESNKFFLLRQQDYANEKLKQRGYLFLNEVYDMLGLSRTGVGQIIGWVYDESNPVGDNYVDFGLFRDCNRKFINGKEKSILLDFNVDGDILDHI